MSQVKSAPGRGYLLLSGKVRLGKVLLSYNCKYSQKVETFSQQPLKLICAQRSSMRFYPLDFFKKPEMPEKKYDAFDKDIAIVQISFQKSTAILMGSQQAMTWIDYLSNVGGLLGLVLGMGFVSFIELIWLALRIFALKNNFSKWIT
jgi:hypothetical protein